MPYQKTAKNTVWLYLAMVLGLLTALGSCGKKGKVAENVPDYVLPKDTMVLIITDYHLIEAELVQARGRGKDVNQLRDHYYAAIFERYGIDQTTLDKNFRYYKDNIGVLEEVYQDVVIRLSRQESEVENMNKTETEIDTLNPDA